ncbi:peroxide stress protein YaaA [Stratiformator vulcanicus]|uniref:UPF0246 protein Pan189_35770 n=1 Tax=Stratiformator vulcanicus TaxID=2527980 RepID=A0A517R5L1_9PLAN|nr:peroxide stress protein YaaA [Stratiformator vulcanicus]QDT39174.1 hypothetical protein Pan189_35770 [Stratiformator vulcanicus]
MLCVLSPSKTMEPPSKSRSLDLTEPRLLDESQKLVERLRKFSSKQLQNLMGISEDLADLNRERFSDWSRPHDAGNSVPAALYFRGDVYDGFDADSLTKRDLDYAQNHVRILSGLYGLLRPLDLIQPYRLEMGTKFTKGKPATLYDFWGDRLTETLREDLTAGRRASKALVNLASNEYFKAIDAKSLDLPVVIPAFKEKKEGKLVMMSFYAKKARGLMARYIVESRAKSPDDLKDFSADGYCYNAEASSDAKPVFSRPYPNG